MSVFPERLSRQRELRNFTQKELSKLTGISNTAISLMETGIRKPSVEFVGKLAKALGVSSDYLLGMGEFAVPEQAVAATPAIPKNQLLREQFAIAFAQAHLQSGESEGPANTAKIAVAYTDALIKELSK